MGQMTTSAAHVSAVILAGRVVAVDQIVAIVILVVLTLWPVTWDTAESTFSDIIAAIAFPSCKTDDRSIGRPWCR